MGCVCVGRRDNSDPIEKALVTAPSPAVSPSPDISPRRHEQRSSSRRSTFDPKVMAWNIIKTLRGPISQYYREETVLAEEKKAKLTVVTHLASNERCVLKCFPKKEYVVHDPDLEEDKVELPEELAVCRLLDYPYILRAYEFLEDDENYYIVFEHYAADLESMKRSFGPDGVCRIGKIMIQIMRALQFAHGLGLVHKCLNLKNVLIKEDGHLTVKVSGFGAGPKEFKKQDLKKSPFYHYIAPELLMCSVSPMSDIWSCGMIMYVLISGIDDLKKAHHQPIEFPRRRWQFVPKDIQELVQRMLSRDHTQRPTPQEFLQHPWVQSLDSSLTPTSKPVRDTILIMGDQSPRNLIREALINFVLTRVYPSCELEKMSEIFRALDCDQNGRITRQDIVDVLERIMPSAEVESKVDVILQNCDLDNNGSITFSEFLLSAVDENEVFSRENVLKVFWLLDTDCSGTLTAQKLKRAFYVSGPEDQVDKIWRRALRQVDHTETDRLEYWEFVNFCKKSMKPGRCKSPLKRSRCSSPVLRRNTVVF